MALSPAAGEAWRTLQDLLMLGPGHDQFVAACTGEGLTPGPVKALLRLAGAEPQAMRDLAATLACDASYVTTLTDALEDKGFAERRPHPSDRRVRTIVLTPEGEAAVARLREAMAQPPAAFGALTAAEQATLRDLLRKLADAGGTERPLPARSA